MTLLGGLGPLRPIHNAEALKMHSPKCLSSVPSITTEQYISTNDQQGSNLTEVAVMLVAS